LEIVRAADFGIAASLRISGFCGQPGNVMFYLFYDIIAEAIAVQRFPALALLALARKCHETCGYVTFYEIFGRAAFNSRYRNAFASGALNTGDRSASCLIVCLICSVKPMEFDG
jgi:hypothetical protein